MKICKNWLVFDLHATNNFINNFIYNVDSYICASHQSFLCNHWRDMSMFNVKEVRNIKEVKWTTLLRVPISLPTRQDTEEFLWGRYQTPKLGEITTICKVFHIPQLCPCLGDKPETLMYLLSLTSGIRFLNVPVKYMQRTYKGVQQAQPELLNFRTSLSLYDLALGPLEQIRIIES